MKTTRKFTYATLLICSSFVASSASGAVIAVPDFSFAPDGSTDTSFQNTNVGSVLPTGEPPKVTYLVTTFNFGVNSDAHIQAQFTTSTTSGNRVGVEVHDDGLVRNIGGGTTDNFNLAQNMAGQSVTLLVKLDYDSTHSVTYSRVGANDDTIMSIWVNPTGSSVEGSGLTGGDLQVIWNSAGFSLFRQAIQNQSTPGTAGTSSITDTTILTGADATFANALALAAPAAAAIPEPSTALLSALGLLALLRRRR